MKNQIVILAAGKGTRMGGSMPKVLVMLKNKPLILYLLEEVEKVSQLVKPVVVVGYKKNLVMDVLGGGYTYAVQEEQLGTANALLSAKRKVKADNILVLNGDHPFTKAESLKALIEIHFKAGAKISMLTTQVENFSGKNKPLEHYGRIVRDPVTHNIAAVIEYKDANEAQRKTKELNINIYMFNTKWLWENLQKVGNKNAQREFLITDIVNIAARAGEIVHSIMVEPQEAIGINSREDLEVAEKILGLTAS